MPSQKRTPIGLLYDKLTPKFLKNKVIQCLIEDRPKFYVVPINFYQDLEVYSSYKLPLCLQKIKSHQSKAVSDPDTFDKEWNRLSSWVNKNEIKLIDETETIIKGVSRSTFKQEMKAFIKKQSWRVRWNFDVPASIDFKNDTAKDIDRRIEIFNKLAYKESLKYPVFIKTQAAQHVDNAHLFYCVNNEDGMRQALENPAFNCEILI